jgi:hypothetical protein
MWKALEEMERFKYAILSFQNHHLNSTAPLDKTFAAGNKTRQTPSTGQDTEDRRHHQTRGQTVTIPRAVSLMTPSSDNKPDRDHTTGGEFNDVIIRQ